MVEVETPSGHVGWVVGVGEEAPTRPGVGEALALAAVAPEVAAVGLLPLQAARARMQTRIPVDAIRAVL